MLLLEQTELLTDLCIDGWTDCAFVCGKNKNIDMYKIAFSTCIFVCTFFSYDTLFVVVYYMYSLRLIYSWFV